jgi:hypothetical protein
MQKDDENEIMLPESVDGECAAAVAAVFQPQNAHAIWLG